MITTTTIIVIIRIIILHVQAEKRGDLEWMRVLGLCTSDIMVVEKREMLLDTHMLAAHKLIQKQFPNLDGCQSTLLCQNRGFSAVYGRGI